MIDLSELGKYIREADLRIVIKNGKLEMVDGYIKLNNFYASDIGEFLDCVKVSVSKCSEGICKAIIDYSWC